jgi:hypothetical protein
MFRQFEQALARERAVVDRSRFWGASLVKCVLLMN